MSSSCRSLSWIIVALLAGCRSDEAAQADKQILCSLDGKAFYVQPHVGDTVFMQRVPSSDPLCRRKEWK